MGLLKLLFGKKVKKVFEEAVNVAKDDKELQQSYTDLAYHTDKLELLNAGFHIEFPNSSKFIGKSDREMRLLNENYKKVLLKFAKTYPEDSDALKKLEEMGWSNELR